MLFKAAKKGALYFVSILSLLFFSTPTYSKSPYTWYVFNIPPFGSESEGGIGYELVKAYSEAGFENKIILANAARWIVDMTNPNEATFCSSGSWKLPNTSHRIYSDSIINTVDYGVAVRPELYRKLSNNGQTKTVSISDVINSTKSAASLMILKGRPVFGRMSQLIENGASEAGSNITYMTASDGPISMLKMATIENRNVDSVLVFPEEFSQFSKDYPGHSLQYLTLSEGSSFAPIRASCPNTMVGREIISGINKLLSTGLREKAFKLFQDALPDMVEIRDQAVLNQFCIKDNTCKDPLTD